MQREVQMELIRRALERVSGQESDADGEPFELPVERYLDQTRFERERALLRATPVVVGFASQVASPGDFFTHDHGGVPIVVTRDRAGALHAFLNACRHRGTKIADDCGRTDRLACPYHGWTYDLAGRLQAVPHRGDFSGADLATRNLVELPVWQRFGLIFARLTPGPATAPVHPFGDDLDGFGLADHVLFAPSVRERRLNWKLMIDGSWETYHFRVTHARTIASRFIDNTGVFDFAEPDVRMVLVKRTLTDLAREDPSTWQLRRHANVLFSLFPNTIVLVQPDHAMVVTVWPTAVDRSTIVGGMLVPEPAVTDKAVAHWQRNEEIFWSALEEDIDMGARIQATLASGANRTLVFGKNEHLIAKYNHALDARLPQSLTIPGTPGSGQR